MYCCSSNEQRDKSCMQNFGRQTPWETDTWNTENRYEGRMW